jgi:hypothetical protein
MAKEGSKLCEIIRRLGYAQNTQVRLYGEIFDIISDPFSVAENVVFIDARERKSGRTRRIRLPLSIIHTAKKAA